MACDNVLSIAASHFTYMQDIRRRIHQNPELAFQEMETSALIARNLEETGLEVLAGIGGTGLIATLNENASKRKVLVRADMDALPMTEENKLPFRSRTPGGFSRGRRSWTSRSGSRTPPSRPSCTSRRRG